MRRQVLIVEAQESLGRLWQSFLERQGFEVSLVGNQSDAIDKLRFGHLDVLVIDLVLPNSSALAISDFASYKNPDISIIVVSSDSFFSDGSIFELLPNARGFMNQPIEPGDLVAVVDHCTRPVNRDRVAHSN
jgi:DNA-binding NtrC family response regulator